MATDQFLFNSGKGLLQWEADGTGGVAVTIATLLGVTSLTTSDFLIL